jgi:hypothetical protein
MREDVSQSSEGEVQLTIGRQQLQSPMPPGDADARRRRNDANTSTHVYAQHVSRMVLYRWWLLLLAYM